MTTVTFKNGWLTFLALLLVLPTGFFLLANVLNEVGVPGLYNVVDPFVEKAGGGQALGWNINLLILFGPVLALLLTIFQVLQFQVRFAKEEFRLSISVKKRWFPLLVTALAMSLLAILFFYALGENCNC